MSDLFPLVASEQYGMRFIQSQQGKIVWRCDWLPFEILKAMVDAANAKAKESKDGAK